MSTKLFVATKAFIMHNGKVLIVRESGKYQDGTNMGKYDVVGGRITPGEKLHDALKREVKEETGLDVTIKESFFVSEWHPAVKGGQWQIVGIFFECIAETNAVTLSRDHDEFLWINPQSYINYPLIENLYSAFQAYLRKR